MPRFDFQCKRCHAIFEDSLPFGSKRIPACPTCRSKAVDKLIAPPGIVFKGAGWYKTDSRRKGTEGTKGTDGTEEKKVKKDDAPLTETKVAETKPVEKK